MPDPPPQNAAPSSGGPTRLNGWKDIATYLDRGVRTVQRWEKDFGLPVRRLGPGRGEGVFAFTHEIDAWQATSQAAHARRDSQNVSSDAGSGPAEDHSPDTADGRATPGDGGTVVESGGRQLKIVIAVLAIAVVASVAWAGWSTWLAFGTPPPSPAPTVQSAGKPAAWRVEGNSLVVVDAEGRTCWTHPLTSVLDVDHYGRQSRGVMGSVGDIDGDGRREIWFVESPLNGDATHMRLHCFNEDGTPRWVYQHEGSAAFGSVAYSGPWTVFRTFVTEDPNNPARFALWVSSRDSSEFPALLVRLDITTGVPVGGPYWSNGWVNAVSLLRGPEGSRLLVGVTNNEKQAPGIVVLDAANIAGTAPAEAAKYRCTTGPVGEPLAVAAFPKPRRFTDTPGSGSTETVLGGGEASPIVATVTYAMTKSGTAASAVFRLHADLTPLRADPADNYMPAYEQFVRDGEVPKHGPLAKDPTSELVPIQRWDRTARRYVPVPLAARGK